MARPRQLVRLLVGGLLYYSGIFRYLLKRRARQGTICVLGLHRILDQDQRAHSASQDAIVLAKDAFEEILEFLKQHFQLASLEEMSFQKRDGGRPQCVITFDDGWQDNYSTAYPVLKRKAIPATIFLVTGMIGTQTIFWVERLRLLSNDPAVLPGLRKEMAATLNTCADQVTVDELIEFMKHMPSRQRQRLLDRYLPQSSSPLGGNEMLTWEQVREMSAHGIEFGSHTDSHPLLTEEEAETIDRELVSSRQKLEAVLGNKAKAFAYPNGDCNPRVCERVRAAGYEYAFTTRSGWYTPHQDAYTAPRILLHDGNVRGRNGKFSPAAFSLTLMGWR